MPILHTDSDLQKKSYMNGYNELVKYLNERRNKPSFYGFLLNDCYFVNVILFKLSEP